MSLDQLRYFVAIAETGSTQAASRRVHISQPPLSRQVRALETELGTSLFQRTSRGMLLEPAGEVFLEHARRILQSVDQARSELSAFASASKKQRAVGKSDAFNKPGRPQ